MQVTAEYRATKGFRSKDKKDNHRFISLHKNNHKSNGVLNYKINLINNHQWAGFK